MRFAAWCDGTFVTAQVTGLGALATQLELSGAWMWCVSVTPHFGCSNFIRLVKEKKIRKTRKGTRVFRNLGAIEK